MTDIIIYKRFKYVKREKRKIRYIRPEVEIERAKRKNDELERI